MDFDDHDPLSRNARALKEAVIQNNVEDAVEILRHTGSAERARELACTANKLPDPMIANVTFGYSVSIDGAKETITLYRREQHFVQPIASVTFTR